MLCPYHGDYNDRLDRCPACVELRQRTRESAAWIVPVEMTELATLRARIAAAVAECEEIESASERRGSYADELDTSVCAAEQNVVRRIRAKLEGR